MNSEQKSTGVQTFFFNLVLTALASVLFAASFPNLLAGKGIAVLAFVAYVPVFVIIQRTSFAGSIFWGALYGYFAYTLFNYWLNVFHPMAGIITGLLFAIYMAALFPLMKFARLCFPRRAYIAQWILWLAYEYLRTLGFLGYSYGVTGYSQWNVLPLIQMASLFGVWGVSALVAFPSLWLAAALEGIEIKSGIKTCARAVKAFFLKDKIPPLVWAVLLCAAFVGGFISMKDYDSAPKARLALIQHNSDPWRGGIAEYRRNYEVLRRLSDEALAADPAPEMVVWPETAFVPRIYWHETYREAPASWALVKDLLQYLAEQEKPFVIGNDHAVKDPAKNPNHNEGYRIDYNAALMYENGKNTQSYYKHHLVPFTEHFPYKKQFPRLHQMLVEADTHFWEKGTEATVFSGPGFTFSSPICFEDTFGYLSRNFVRLGADLIINLSNDAWSASLPAQNQHLAMSVFRAVENRRSVARSTSSGQTCAIDPSGRILGMAEPFTEAWINVDVPLVKGKSLYTRFGDFLGMAFVFMAFGLLIFGVIHNTIKKIKQGNRNEYP